MSKCIVWQCGCVVYDRPRDALNRHHEQIHCAEQIHAALAEVAAAAYEVEVLYGWPALITAEVGMAGHTLARALLRLNAIGVMALLFLASSIVHAQGIVRVTTEATCANPAHQCTYSQRVDPATGKVLGRGSITISYLGHQTAPQIVPLSAQQSFLTTISDVMGSGGGIVARRDFLGGFPVTPIVKPSAFLLDLDPRSRWNGVSGAGRRIATLWRRVRSNDHKLNAANEPWAMFLSQWDWVGTAPTLVRLGMTQLTDWSTKPGYSYGYPINSRWNTALEHIDGGGWAVGFQLDGDYVVGALTETGDWLWRQSVGPCVDYAGDVSVRGDRVGYVTTRPGPDGVELVLGER